jgi:hypothetical protein
MMTDFSTLYRQPVGRSIVMVTGVSPATQLEVGFNSSPSTSVFTKRGNHPKFANTTVLCRQFQEGGSLSLARLCPLLRLGVTAEPRLWSEARSLGCSSLSIEQSGWQLHLEIRDLPVCLDSTGPPWADLEIEAGICTVIAPLGPSHPQTSWQPGSFKTLRRARIGKDGGSRSWLC